MTEMAGFTGLLVAFASLGIGPALSESPAASERVLEIRSYNLTPGTRERFHEQFVRESLPLLRRWNIDVVAYGPSRHDKDSYFLMRAFSSLEERDRIEQAFYDSPEWRNGPRASVLAAIASYTTVVIQVDDDTLRGLRGPVKTANPFDLDLLLRLNDDYIDAAKTSNVKRFTAGFPASFLISCKPFEDLSDKYVGYHAGS